MSLYLGLLHSLSRYVTPLSQLREHADQEDHSDHWPCWGLGPSSPCLTHWPLRHHWMKAGRGIVSGRVKDRGTQVHTFKWKCEKHTVRSLSCSWRFSFSLLSIPGYILKLFWTVSALSCHQLELTELRQKQLKCGKDVSCLTQISSYTCYFADAFHAALYCI